MSSNIYYTKLVVVGIIPAVQHSRVNAKGNASDESIQLLRKFQTSATKGTKLRSPFDRSIIISILPANYYPGVSQIKTCSAKIDEKECLFYRLH